MKKIKLGNLGVHAIVDDSDYETLSRYTWHRIGNRYAGRRDNSHPKRQYIMMHNVVMNPPDGMCVDHINGNGLDNRRENLRICTHSQNEKNKRKSISARKNSKYKGVIKRKGKRRNYYYATITVNGRNIRKGRYESERCAAIVYNELAKKYHGDFAFLNNIQYTQDEYRGILDSGIYKSKEFVVRKQTSVVVSKRFLSNNNLKIGDVLVYREKVKDGEPYIEVTIKRNLN